MNTTKTEAVGNARREELLRQCDDLQRQVDATSKCIDELKALVGDSASLAGDRDQMATRLEYLKLRAAVREKYLAKPVSNDKRQKELNFNGIRPKRMDVVHFHVAKTSKNEELDGIALVRDENHYYLAVDMYEQEDQPDNITTIMDENPDGTFDGIWPKNVVLKAASKFEERYMRTITDQYADELDKAEAFIIERAKAERKELEELQPKVDEMSAKLADYDANYKKLEEARKVRLALNFEISKVKDELAKIPDTEEEQEAASTSAQGPMEGGLDFNLQEPELEPVEGLDMDTDVEKRCPHLPYLRGKREMTTMSWPAIGTDLKPWLRYRQMANIARMMDKLKDGHAITYIMSGDYFAELSNRAKHHYKGMLPQDVVAGGESSCGVLVFPAQGAEDTIIYHINRRGMLIMYVIYIRDGRLMFYESFSEQEIIGEPRTDIYICQSLRESGTDAKRLFSWVRNLVVSFLAMERDMERTVKHLIEDGVGLAMEMEIQVEDAVDTTDDRDIAIRDASWYTDITVNRQIPVRGYISHRLCGTGKDKVIKEVWVRPHVKKGYHRAAEVKKD